MRTVRPQVTKVEGIPSPSRKQAVQVYQDQEAKIEWIVRDEKGNPIDLRQIADPQDLRVMFRVMESLSASAQVPPICEFSGEVVNAEEGKVASQISRDCVQSPGIYHLEIAIFVADSTVIEVINQGYLIVDRSIFGRTVSHSGPPALAEIRLHLRDSGPEDNYLLDEVEFDLAELAACIERPVMLWNESLPYVGIYYTTQTFPFRYHWLNGIVAGLYELASHHYRRNKVAYSGAGGTSLNDKDKSQEYEEKARSKWGEFMTWMRNEKIRHAVEDCFGSTG